MIPCCKNIFLPFIIPFLSALTKKYEIEGEENVNLNKIIFNEFAKENITIFEMKKPEASLEDAFMKIIKEGGDK